MSSNLIARFSYAHVAQLVEHILGKDGVHGFESRRGLVLVLVLNEFNSNKSLTSTKY